MKKILKNCRIISPDLEIENGSIVIDGEYIAEVCSGPKAMAGVESVDVGGRMTVPGFIDIHSHGAGGHDVTDGSLKAIENIAELKLKEGVTTFLPTTLTLPEARLAAALKTVAQYQKKMPYAKVPGVHLEGPFLSDACLGAQNPQFVRKPDLAEIKRLSAIVRVLIVTFAIEVEGGSAFTAGLRALGITPSCGHSAAPYADFLRAKAQGLKHLTHFCNQMSALHHREIGLVGAGLLDDDTVVELIADKIHLCPEMIKLAFKVKPIEKICLITDAIAAAWLADGDFTLGGLKVRVENGAARLTPAGNLAGSTLHLNQALKNVYEITGLALPQLIKTTSFNQARSLGLPALGKIEKGYRADIAVLDEEFVPSQVLVNGEFRL